MKMTPIGSTLYPCQNHLADSLEIALPGVVYLAQTTNIGAETKKCLVQELIGEKMSLDKELCQLPLASPGQRFGSFILDRLIVLAAGFIAWLPALLIAQAISNQVLAFIIQAVAVASAVIFVAMQGIYFRVGDTGQTLGMSLMGVAMASETKQFKSSIMNRIFAWVHHDSKSTSNSWAGDEGEGRSDAQLWRGLIPGLLFPLTFMFIGLAVRIVVGIPFIIESALRGDLNLAAINDVVFGVLISPVIAIYVFTQIGFLFCLNSDRRTLVDHFLSIKLVDTKDSVFHFKKSDAKSYWKWLSGADFSYSADKKEDLVSL